MSSRGPRVEILPAAGRTSCWVDHPVRSPEPPRWRLVRVRGAGHRSGPAPHGCGSCCHRGGGTSHGAGVVPTEVVAAPTGANCSPTEAVGRFTCGVGFPAEAGLLSATGAGPHVAEAAWFPTVRVRCHRGDCDSHGWCSSAAGEPVSTLRPSIAHALRRTGWCGHCDGGVLSAPANRSFHDDAIWSTGPAFLRGVARGPLRPKASRTSSERTRSRRSSVIRLTCAPVSRPSRVSPFRPSDRSA